MKNRVLLFLACLALGAAAIGGWFFLKKTPENKSTAVPAVVEPIYAWSVRSVAGITLESPGDFQGEPVALSGADAWMESGESAHCLTSGFEIDVTRTRYQPGSELSIAAAAQGGIDALEKMEGVKKVSHTESVREIGGKPAKRLSMTAEREEGPLHLESLLILDKRTLYQIQTLYDFSNPRGAEFSERVLNSVKLAR